MKSRCNKPTAQCAEYYHGRGISVCERWDKFENFLEDMGYRPGDDYHLDRINNEGDYCKDNCQWITRKDNLRKQDKVIKVIINNEEKTLMELCKEHNLNHDALYRRYKRGLRGKELIKPYTKRRTKRKTLFWFLSHKGNELYQI